MTVAIPGLARIPCTDAETGFCPVVVVTGASAGLGQFLSVALARRGCRVAGVARSRTELEQTAALCPPEHFLPVVADVSDQQAVNRAFQRIAGELGPVGILIAGAAIYPRHDVVTQPDAPVQQVLAVNLVGQVNCAMAALAQMVPEGKGRIVMVGSFAGDAPLPGSLGYSVSKAGGRALARALVVETSARLPEIVISEWLPPILATRMGHADGVPPAIAAEWCAELAMDCDPALHGMVFAGPVEHRPPLGWRQRLRNLLTLRRPKPLRRLDGGRP